MQQRPGFRLTFHDVTRDENQGNYGHRRRLDDPSMALICDHWDRLVVFNTFAAPTDLRFGSIETGGAHPQCFSVFLGKDFTQTHLFLRRNAPYTDLRHLWRCANGNNLLPTHPDDLFFLLSLYARDMATDKASLTLKAFDSQGIVREMEPTFAMIQHLRSQGLAIRLELAFPYSQARSLAGVAIYPHAMLVERMLAGLRSALALGLPASALRLSIKDMVGEIDEAESYHLIKRLLLALRSEGLAIDVGLHTHDTGLALRAYVGAIRAALEEDWPFHADIVSGRPLTFGESIERPGFVHPLDLLEALQAEGFPISLHPRQREILESLDRLQEEISRRSRSVRIPDALRGEDLRRYGIPGGGQADLVVGTRQAKIADDLRLSEAEALHLVGHALIAVAEVMGYPLPVTPGFKNKQTAALHLVTSLFRQGDLTPYLGDRAALQEVVLQSPFLPHDKLERLWAGLDLSVRDFVAGEMPIEDPIHADLRASLADGSVRLRSLLKIPKRQGLLTDGVPSRLADLRDHAKSLGLAGDALDRVVANGLVQITLSDAKIALADPPCEPDPALFPTRDDLRVILDAGRLQKFQRRLPWKVIDRRIFQTPALSAALLHPSTHEVAFEAIRLGLSAQDTLAFLQSPEDHRPLFLRLLRKASQRYPSLPALDAVAQSLLKHIARYHQINRFYGLQDEDLWLADAEKNAGSTGLAPRPTP